MFSFFIISKPIDDNFKALLLFVGVAAKVKRYTK